MLRQRSSFGRLAQLEEHWVEASGVAGRFRHRPLLFWGSNGFDMDVKVGEAIRSNALKCKLKINANRTFALAA